MRFRSIGLFLACALATRARAQAPDAGPLLLRLPASTRATALGNAWVAGRDEDVVFYNPAQIAARTGFNLTLARYGPGSVFGSMASGFAAGPWSLAIGWGLQFATFDAAPSEPYPFSPDVLLGDGFANATSFLATVGANITFKGFRIGVANKFATDRLTTAFDSSPLEGTRDALLLDAGISRNFLSGVASVAVQNMGHGVTNGGGHFAVPHQTVVGWSRPYGFDQVDLAVTGQVVIRDGWTGGGAGLELGYGWIEGWSAAARLGARRPESGAEKPIALGGTLNGDHLTLEYALQLFDQGHKVHRVTIRWR